MAKPQKNDSAEPLAYIGPRRMEPFPLSRGAVFTSLPPLLKKAMANDKNLAAQFVPLSEAGKALRGAARSKQ